MLGQGAFGAVSKALHKRTGELFAVKVLSATSLCEINSIKKEIQILRLCDNEHIVKYYGCYLKVPLTHPGQQPLDRARVLPRR